MAKREYTTSTPGGGRGTDSMSRRLNREKGHGEGVSVYGARTLMPDPEGLAHACGVVAASARARYGRTEAEDAVYLMDVLGLVPAKESKSGRDAPQ